MKAQNERKDLGFLGEDFQYKLVREFTDDKELFKDLNSVIDQNMFTDPNLKTYVGVMKEYYDKYGSVPSYDIIRANLFDKSHSDTEREFYSAIVEKIKHTPTDGSEFIRETSTKFFKQQNIIKVANEILKIAGNGEVTHYDRCVELLNGAINAGSHDDLGSGVFDNEEETLSDDYRVPIPTGIEGIDETLEGGIGKGELGVIVGPSSFGKAQPLDARIVTPFGFKLMGEIKVGDFVVGNDGLPHEVTGVFPQGLRPIYKVSFSNGTSCECDKEHLWNVNSLNQRTGKDGCVKDMSFKTLTLSEILKEGIKRLDGKLDNFIIPITEPVWFINEKPTEYDPYEIGCSAESEILSDYLFNSFGVRLDLLQGLMDANGDVDESGLCEFKTTSETLAKQVQFLVRSLGGCSNITKTKTFLFSGERKSKIEEDFTYRVTVSLTEKEMKIFRVDKKQECVVYGNKDSYEVSISNVEYVGEKEAQCIMVDSKEHLYLTEDFIVTHNTSLTTAIAGFASTYPCAQNNNEGYKVLQIVFEDRVKQIQRKHFGRITGIESKDLGKPEYLSIVKEQLDHYESKEMMENNLRILRLPSGEKTAWDIERIIKRFINNGFRPDLVIVDYFECLAHRNDGSQSEWEQEGKTMRKFESMAGTFNMAFWIPLQGTKESVNMELVTMDKAGGSFKKIQIAHIVMSIARSNEDIAENKATIAILKNRAGKAGKVFNNVEFNNGTCRISTSNCDDGLDSMFAFDKKQQKDRDNLAAEIFKKYKEEHNTK